MVYFRNFDMDDPSAHSEVDPDTLGNDNNGSVPGGTGTGRLSSTLRACRALANGIVRCSTNSEGVAIVDFTVTMQPGDNFAIAASTSETEINSVGFKPDDGLHLTSASRQPPLVINSECAPSEKVCRSRLLTVWRRVHIETDAMPSVSGNFIQAKIVPLPPGQQGIRILPGETKQLLVYDPSDPGGFPDDQFENGLLVLGIHKLPISSSTFGSVTVTNNGIQEVFMDNRSKLFLYDDDDFSNNDGANLTGDNGEAIPLPDVFLLPEGSAGDVRTSNVLALAYIRPVYYNANTLGTGFAQQFKANIDDFGQANLNSIIAFDNAGTNQDEKFWTIYLLNAYQARTDRDWDPRDEVPDEDDLPNVGETVPGLASFVFVETGGPKECTRQQPTFMCNISIITAREVARSLGAQPGDEGLLDLQSNVLSSTSLRKIREQTVP